MKAQSGVGTHAVLQRIKSGDAEAAYELIKRLPESERPRLGDEDSDRNGGALFWACCKGYADVAALLLARGAPVGGRTCWGATPLHGAADNNRSDVAELLLKYGAEVDAKTTDGDTPAHLAAYRGHGAVLRLLLKNGANPSARNSSGNDVQDETRRGEQLRRHESVLCARIAEEQAAAADGLERVLCRSVADAGDWEPTDFYSRGTATPSLRVPRTRWTASNGFQQSHSDSREAIAPANYAKSASLDASSERSSTRSSDVAAGSSAVTVRGDLSRSQSAPTQCDGLREYRLTSR